MELFVKNIVPLLTTSHIRIWHYNNYNIIIVITIYKTQQASKDILHKLMNSQIIHAMNNYFYPRL